MLQIGYKTYRQMPIPKGMKNFIPQVHKKNKQFVTFMTTYGMNYHVETMCLCIGILQHCGHLLIDKSDEKSVQLQGITDYIWNFYLNKAGFPLEFWEHV